MSIWDFFDKHSDAFIAVVTGLTIVLATWALAWGDRQ